jgi:hypothetical protein
MYPPAVEDRLDELRARDAELRASEIERDFLRRQYKETKSLFALRASQEAENEIALLKKSRRVAREELRCAARRFGINDFGFSGGPSNSMARWVPTADRPSRKPKAVVVSRTVNVVRWSK